MAVPTLPQRIALVGSAGTSGFRDFCTKVTEHPDRFRVRIEAHQSSVQGVSAAEELAAGIRQAEATQPDLIVLVRGGGGKLDLDAYNDFELCLAIARSSVPVWTGIGHESDLVVADLVAHTAWKTPTEVAVGVVQRFEDASLEVDALHTQLEHLAQAWLLDRHREFEGHWERISSASRHALNRQRLELQNLSRLLQIQAPALIERHRHTLREMRSTVARAGAHSLENAAREIRHCQQRLRGASSRHLAEQKLALAHFKRTLDAIAPEKTLQRGFMLLERNGEVLSRVAGVKEGEQLRLRARDGELDVTVDGATSSPTSS
jgi:exodeoxyribonuclease VII large subunit